MEGRFQFIYNIGNGDIRIYDIFDSGQIKERVTKTDDMNYISTITALRRLEPMIKIAEREQEKFKNVMLYSKTTKTKLDILLVVRRFLLEHPIEENEVRYF
jgi:hypothetical protein